MLRLVGNLVDYKETAVIVAMQSTLLDKIALMITDEEPKIHEAALRVIQLLSKHRRMIKVGEFWKCNDTRQKFVNKQQVFLLNRHNTRHILAKQLRRLKQ